MAHRLPPAGTKSKDSDHFAFCQVLPKRIPNEKRSCAGRVGACQSRPRCAVLTMQTSSDAQSCRLDTQDYIQIRCVNEDSDGPAPAAAPLGSCGQCEDIIVIKPSGEDNQSDLKWPGAPTNQIRNMRRREVVMRDAERLPSPAFIEFVDNPFLVTDGGDAWADKMQGDQCEDSLDVNVGSESDCCKLTGELEPGRTYYVPMAAIAPAAPKDNRPKMCDFRRRKSLI